MAYQFTGNLKGHPEYIFRQSAIYGGIGHIVCNADDFVAALHDPELRANLRVETYCGRNYKYSNYSLMDRREGVVRNACEYCFTEYDPEDEQEARKRRRHDSKASSSELPF